MSIGFFGWILVQSLRKIKIIHFAKTDWSPLGNIEEGMTYQLMSCLSPEDLVRDIQVEHEAALVLLHSGDIPGPDLQLVLRHQVTVGRLVEVPVHLHHLQLPHDPPEHDSGEVGGKVWWRDQLT